MTIDLTNEEKNLLINLLSREYNQADDRRMDTFPDSPEEQNALTYQRSLELLSEKLAGRA